MTFASFGPESDVYVIRRLNDKRLSCVGCKISQPPRLTFFRDKVVDTALEMISHLWGHLEKGQNVPEEAFFKLSDEVDETEVWEGPIY